MSAATLAQKRWLSAERIWRGVAAKKPSREPNASAANEPSARRFTAAAPDGKSARQGAAMGSRACAGRGFGGARSRAASIGVGAARVVFVILNSVETRFAEGPVAPPPRAQRREEDDHGVVAAPAAHRVAPRAGVRLVEAVAAADARELARDRLELLRLPVVLAVREDAARANVVLREALL